MNFIVTETTRDDYRNHLTLCADRTKDKHFKMKSKWWITHFDKDGNRVAKYEKAVGLDERYFIFERVSK